MKSRALIAAFAAFAVPLTGGAEDEKKDTENAIAAVFVQDLEGEPVGPFKCDPKQKAAVVIFTTTDCPIANAYAPEINRLYLAYASRGVRLTLVHADHTTTAEKAQQHAGEYELKPPVTIDRDYALVKATEAKVTPEAFVYDAEGKLRYRGRINNLFADLGQRRAQVTVHDLRDAIEAVINDREVVTSETEALGCYIEVP